MSLGDRLLELVYPRIGDERGRRWPLCRVKAAPQGISRTWIRTTQEGGILTLITGAVMAFALGRFVWDAIDSRSINGLGAVTWTILVDGLFLLLFLFGRRLMLRLANNELLRQEVCASCGYDLSGGENDPDGLRICPECGAAWKLSP
jgi:hypothetical protein